jgi:ATP-dependent RNA helicase DDX42
MKDHISISIGKTGAASKSVKQVIHVVDKEEDKFLWLMDHIGSFLSQGSVLIFALTKVSCEDIGKRLARVGIRTAVLHGDKLQHEREEIINSFKGRRVNCLIATDVAARGLDIQGLDVIINYELAKDLDSHVHRIGRTGRAGRQGTAHTLISKDKPSKLIPMLISSLQEAGQHVPDELWTLSRTVSSSTSKSASLTSSFVRPRQH